MKLNQISFQLKPANIPIDQWIAEFLSVGVTILQASTRTAGYCYATTYRYPVLERASLREDGSIRWKKIAQHGGPGRGWHRDLPPATDLHADAPGYGQPFAV